VERRRDRDWRMDQPILVTEAERSAMGTSPVLMEAVDQQDKAIWLLGWTGKP